MPTKLHVGNLPDDCSEGTIRDLFMPFGDVTEVTRIKNFAFVNFVQDSDAKRALQDLADVKLLGKQIKVNVSIGKGAKERREDNHSQKNLSFKRKLEKKGDIQNNQRNPSKRKNEKRDHRSTRKKSPKRDFHYSKLKYENNVHQRENINPMSMNGFLGLNPSPSDFNTAIMNSIGGLGILSSMITGAAVADEQRSLSEVAPTTEDLKGSGFVIYDSYYVDPKHPLMRGLPIPELPRITDCPAILGERNLNFNNLSSPPSLF